MQFRNSYLHRVSNYMKNPFLLFLPYFIILIIIISNQHSDAMYGDESRYIKYAGNLIRGFYSPPSPDIDLTNGPGYPMILVPFILFHLPLICITLMNGLFHYLSVVFVFKTLQQLVSLKGALVFGLFWMCYINAYQFMSFIISESFSIFLVSILIYYLLKAFSLSENLKAKKFLYISGFIMGYLTITKIIFGYVLLFMLVGIGLLWIMNRKSNNYRRSFFIILIAFITTTPYLIYTYHLTGRLFYWGTSGGNNLYWMSTPTEGEYGDWIEDPNLGSDTILTNDIILDFREIDQKVLANSWRIPGSKYLVKSNHRKDYEEILKYKGIEQDDAYKRIVINNIKSNPKKYVKNIIANIGRLLFDFPYSYKLQNIYSLKRITFNGPIIILTLFCLIPTLLNWCIIPFPIRFMLFFILLYLGGTIIGSVETRMFNIAVPVLLLWNAWIIQNTIKIKLRFE